MQLDVRRGTGNNGRKVLVLANAFKIGNFPQYTIVHYDVDIQPEVPARVNRQVFAAMKNRGMFGNVAAVYDGRKNLYAPASLPFPGSSARATVTVLDSDRPVREGREPSGRTFRVSIREVAKVNLQELGAFISGRQPADATVLMAINALNVMIRHEPSLEYLSKKTSFYPALKPGDPIFYIKGGLEMWAGYFTSIRPAPQKLVVNIDRTAMPLIASGDLVSIAAKYMRLNDPAQLPRVLDRARIQLERFLKGIVIITRSMNSVDGKSTREKSFKIRAVSKDPASTFSFTDDGGRSVTIQAYFQQMYNYSLRYPSLPCVQVTKRAWYPMEVCAVKPGNKWGKKLTPDQVAEIIKFTSQPPSRRLALTREGLGFLGLSKSPTLRAWGTTVDQTPMQVKARVLDPPTLAFADQRGGGEALVMPRDGGWDIRGKRSTVAAKVDRWYVVVFDDQTASGPGQPGLPMNVAQGMVTSFVQACMRFGMQFGTQQPVIHYAGPTMDVRGAFIKAAGLAKYSPTEPPQLIVTFVPAKNSKQYPEIKRVGDTVLGVATQNLVIATASRSRAQYWENVALKVNVKLAGVNHVIKNGLVPGFDSKPAIVFGADVGHPGPGSSQPSVAAVVASFDQHGLQYGTAVRIQRSRQEIIDDLESMAVGLLRKFRINTGKKPEKVIFYRDGVSEGQYQEVCRSEIASLKRACASLESSYTPPITYIICGKRHHIRFFPSTQDGGDRSGNVRAGTVVDLDIVHPTDNDFYLMSHGGLLGTSRPCHYTSLLDENKLSADAMQQLTYSLAHIYPRSTRSVSISSPAYYAHHVATRARAWLGSDLDDDSSTMASSASSGREAELREAAYAKAQQRVRQVHTNLENTMYFM